MSASEVLVTGGTGVLGSKVVELLRSAGVGARVLSWGGRPGTIRGNLLTGEGLDQIVRGADTVVHCASSPFRKTRRVASRERSACSKPPTGPASRTSSTSPSWA